MKFRFRSVPRGSTAVMTSELVAHLGARAARVSRTAEGGWIYVSGREPDDAEPIYVHFEHLVHADPTLSTLALARGQYALRSTRGDDWHIFGPVSDDEYDGLLSAGVIAEQQEQVERLDGA